MWHLLSQKINKNIVLVSTDLTQGLVGEIL